MSTFSRLHTLGQLVVSGPDAGSFLQGQVTSDVLALKPGEIGTGALCNPKGRVIANFLLARNQDGYRLYIASDLVEAVGQHLRKYVLRSKVDLQTTPHERIGIGVGVKARESLLTLGYPLPQGLGMTETQGLRILCYAENPDLYLLIDAEGKVVVDESSGDDYFFSAEIQRGFPWITQRTRELFLPQMLDLERFDGISYKKGCYTGQEIVTRTHFLGQLKRGLYTGRLKASSSALEGNSIYGGHGEGAESIGSLVNLAPDRDGNLRCLMVLQNDQVSNDQLYLNESGGGRVAISLSTTVLML